MRPYSNVITSSINTNQRQFTPGNESCTELTACLQ